MRLSLGVSMHLAQGLIRLGVLLTAVWIGLWWALVLMSTFRAIRSANSILRAPVIRYASISFGRGYQGLTAEAHCGDKGVKSALSSLRLILGKVGPEEGSFGSAREKEFRGQYTAIEDRSRSLDFILRFFPLN